MLSASPWVEIDTGKMCKSSAPAAYSVWRGPGTLDTVMFAAGGKLNDVVLAISSGVVRRYLLEKGALPEKSMTAAVPISLREEGNTDSNNQVFGMICSIATNIEDPKARLETIIAQSTKSKEMSHPLRALMPQMSNISMLGAPMLVQVLALLYSRSSLSDVLPPAANITVSNVPGPRQTLYAAGGSTSDRLERLYN